MSRFMNGPFFVIVAAAIFIAIVLLTSCATSNPPPPKIVSGATTVEPIRIPVLVPCLTRDQVIAPPPTWMDPTKSGWHNAVAEKIDLKELDAYVVKTQTLIWACVKSLEEEKPK